MTLYLDYVGDIRQYHKNFPYNIKANISNKHKDICSKIQTMAKCIQKIYIFKTISPLYIYIYIYIFIFEHHRYYTIIHNNALSSRLHTVLLELL